ncbi:MAG: hypothetical protein JWQ43_4071 [Glaciihabitans sp.]|nr:hypothetical protein [Glaciihabitans sp.]
MSSVITESVLDTAADADATMRTQMRVLLELAGLTVSEDDFEGMTKSFITARENASLVFSVAAARYEVPAMNFRAKL